MKKRFLYFAMVLLSFFLLLINIYNIDFYDSLKIPTASVLDFLSNNDDKNSNNISHDKTDQISSEYNDQLTKQYDIQASIDQIEHDIHGMMMQIEELSKSEYTERSDYTDGSDSFNVGADRIKKLSSDFIETAEEAEEFARLISHVEAMTGKIISQPGVPIAFTSESSQKYQVLDQKFDELEQEFRKLESQF